LIVRPRLLDLFCGAGGAAMGYHRAGFEVVGVDLRPQPRYPFTFHRGDALTYPLAGFDAIHASPPCQRYSVQTKQNGTMANHPDWIAAVRQRLQAAGVPYVIENVPGAPLHNPIVLCGSMFGLERLRRHRLFECPMIAQPAQPTCRHERQHDCISVTGHAGGTSRRDGGARFASTAIWREIMGIDWMTGKELAEAIPPIYTQYLGNRLLQVVIGD
jgi:DNA (cytosine-5)-methyltransferase 1